MRGFTIYVYKLTYVEKVSKSSARDKKKYVPYLVLKKVYH